MQLIELLATPAEEYPVFPLALTEAHNVEPRVLSDCCNAGCTGSVATSRSSGPASRASPTRGSTRRYWIDLTYLHDQLAAQLAWVERTVARLDSGELAWAADKSDPTARIPQTSHEHKVSI